MGQYFLRLGTGGLLSPPVTILIIDYDNPVSAASAEIWDIDGPEQFQVTAFDAAAESIGTLTSPHGGLNGKPWTWSFHSPNDSSIAKIEITATGTKSLRGFAFDNMETFAAPVPAAFPLGIAGIAGFGYHRKRKARKNKKIPKQTEQKPVK